MNDEIKEILDSLNKIANAEYYPEDLLTYKECQLLLNYITNLQKENEDLKDRLKVMEHFKNSLLEENERLSVELNQNMIERNNYLSRCEKANEYIKENKDKYYHDWGEDDGSYDTYLDETEIDKLSNILNGGDE